MLKLKNCKILVNQVFFLLIPLKKKKLNPKLKICKKIKKKWMK